MTRTPLRGLDFGFETNCFVCEPGNARGLRVPFALDEAGGFVVAEFTLDDTHSGAPTMAHGGVSLAILDEAMAWAALAIARKFAVTRESSARFHQPVHLGERYRAEGRIADHDDETLITEAQIVSHDDPVRVSARAEFTVLSPVQVAAATGTTIDDLEHVEEYLGSREEQS